MEMVVFRDILAIFAKLNKFFFDGRFSVSYFFTLSGLSVGSTCGSSARTGYRFCDRQGR